MNRDTLLSSGFTEERNKAGTIYFRDDEGTIVAKVCTQCDKINWIERFSKSKLGLGSRRAYCKDCQSKSAVLWSDKNKGRRVDYNRDYAANNRDKKSLNNLRRRSRKAALPDDFTGDQMKKTIEYFGGCALTGDDGDVHWDHTIPLVTGHGGTTFGNMIPLRSDLNVSKNHRNIFEWFEANRQRFNLEQWRFDRLINWLASANAMPVEEYRAYVYECHSNPNEIDDESAAI